MYNTDTVKGYPLTSLGGKCRKGDKMDLAMTNNQFDGFLRFLLDAVKEAIEETDSDKRDERLHKIADNIQRTIED